MLRPGRRAGCSLRLSPGACTITSMEVRRMTPRGFYLAHDVGRLAGVSGSTIGQWARYGLIQSSRSEASPRVYSFQDVAEAMAVHVLVDRGFKPAIIRKAINRLR